MSSKEPLIASYRFYSLGYRNAYTRQLPSSKLLSVFKVPFVILNDNPEG